MADAPLFAVVGAPVLPSLSPELFRAALPAMPSGGAYVRLAAPSAADALQTAARLPLAGMNVTAPFKQDMARLVRPGDDAVRATGAVNVVVNRDGEMVGHNTDCMGVVEALKAKGHDPAGRRAIVFGAGGAARAAAYALKTAHAGSVLIVNRTLSRAQEAAALLGCDAAPTGELQARLEHAELFVSCVPRALDALGSIKLRSELVVLDADYHGSALEARAREAGCRVVSGRDWLLHQAVGSHLLFAGASASPDSLAKVFDRSLRPGTRSNVAVIGFMGAGKSTVAPLLASRLGFGIVETDREIEAQAGLDVRALFTQRGEAEFRKIEAAVVQRVATAQRTVFSLGGGALLHPENTEVITRCSLVIWLWADVSTCWQRAADGTRPLLGSRDDAETLMASRLMRYASAADLVIDTSRASPEEIAVRLVDEIRSTEPRP